MIRLELYLGANRVPSCDIHTDAHAQDRLHAQKSGRMRQRQNNLKCFFWRGHRYKLHSSYTLVEALCRLANVLCATDSVCCGGPRTNLGEARDVRRFDHFGKAAVRMVVGSSLEQNGKGRRPVNGEGRLPSAVSPWSVSASYQQQQREASEGMTTTSPASNKRHKGQRRSAHNKTTRQGEQEEEQQGRRRLTEHRKFEEISNNYQVMEVGHQTAQRPNSTLSVQRAGSSSRCQGIEEE